MLHKKKIDTIILQVPTAAVTINKLISQWNRKPKHFIEDIDVG